MDRCIMVVRGAPDRVNMPCLIHDTHICQITSTEPKIYQYKICHDVKTGIQNIYVNIKLKRSASGVRVYSDWTRQCQNDGGSIV